MGGSALLIKGTADLERLSKRRGLGRLFGTSEVKTTKLGGNRTLITAPSHNVEPLIPAFTAYVRREMSAPWPATASIREYLRIATTIYVRGESDGDLPPEWYVQLTFGGCAGMAETSSEVATHWAAKWWNADRAQITSLLTAAGFTPTHIDDTTGDCTFLPLGSLGYASFRRGGYVEPGEPPAHFALDGAVAETGEELAATLGRTLESEWVGYMSDGRCHCQLCDPAFDQSLLKTLPLNT